MKRFQWFVFPCVLLALVAVLLLRTLGAAHAAPAAHTSSCGSWSVVQSPNNGQNSVLDGVAALATNDVWAVGYSGASDTSQLLSEHWNGKQWSVILAANPGSPADFSDVSAVSTNDVWAVGTSNLTSDQRTTLIEHWNGSAWSIVPSVDTGSATFLNGVTALSANDVWAVGSYDDTSNQSTSVTLIEHWDGTSWQIVKDAALNSKYNVLGGIAALSVNNIWMVGSQGYPSPKTLIEHWDGSRWQFFFLL